VLSVLAVPRKHANSCLTVLFSGFVSQDKVRELIKLFRPDREGNLTVLDFVKSVDAVYKELRLLRASISNSTKVHIV